MTTTLTKHCLLASFFCLLSVSCDYANKGHEKTVRKTPASISTTAKELRKAYSDNEVAADLKFKHKVICLAGYVDKVGSGLFGTYSVDLRAGSWGAVVSCEFSKHQAAILANLKKGDLVYVKGKCVGEMLGVTLLGCVLVDSKGKPLSK